MIDVDIILTKLCSYRFVHVLVIRLSNLLVHAQGAILPVLRGQAVQQG